MVSLLHSAEQTIIKHCKHIPNLTAVYIFGSFVAGQTNYNGADQNGVNSDIDVAFLAQTKLSNMARWELAQEMAIALQTDVDLVDLNACSEVLKMQIVTKGKIILCLDNKLVEQFSDTTYWLNLDLWELKAQQYKDIKQRKSIYG